MKCSICGKKIEDEENNMERAHQDCYEEAKEEHGLRDCGCIFRNLEDGSAVVLYYCDEHYQEYLEMKKEYSLRGFANT